VSKGINDAVVQPVTDRPDTVLIKVPLEGDGQDGRVRVREALNEFGKEADPKSELEADPNASYKIVGTDAVGAIAGAQLRNKAIAVTLAALVGILVYIAARFEWTYGAAAVIAVFHDVLVTLGFFSIFQIEISLNVIAALLTLVGFSVNDTIVVFDRIRENRKLHRRDSLYKITNDSINQTLSRTVITNGLVFLSVLALVLFGGDVLRAFSLALFIGVVFGTYSSIAIASPIMVWWEQRIEAANRESAVAFNQPRVVKPARGPKQGLKNASKPLH
jgi:preprotein translocase subunit SecF